MKQDKKEKEGMTLVELLIVVLILTVLIRIAFTSINKVVQKNREDEIAILTSDDFGNEQLKIISR